MKSIKQLFNRRFPETYIYIRKLYFNSYNHIIWLLGRHGQSANEQQNDPYDKDFWEAQENWDYESLAKVLIEHFEPSSVLDIGCGSGRILSAFNGVNANLRLLGMENSPEALDLAQKRGLDVKELNVVKCSNSSISSLGHQLGSFDITLCLEVGEHLPFWHASKLVKILTVTSKTVIFSAAQPGQGGPLHLNEQPPEYWIRKFSAFKYDFNSELSVAIREQLQEINIPSWYKNNLLVFHRT